MDWFDRLIGFRRALVGACLLPGCTAAPEETSSEGTTSADVPETGSDSSGDADESGSDSSSGDPAGCQEWEALTFVSLQARIASAEDGSLWVAGTTEGAGYTQWAYGRYDAEGSLLAMGESGGRLQDSVVAIAAGPGSDAYILGRQGDSPDAKFLTGEGAVARFDADANELWNTILTLDGDMFVDPLDVAVTPDGSTFAVGRASFSESEEGPIVRYSFVVKHGPDGEQQWFDLLFGSEMFLNQATVVTPDGTGGVYVVGDSSGTLAGEPGAGNFDVWAAHYSADGTRNWFEMFGGELRESARDVVADGEGSLYIAAHLDPGAGPIDVPLLLKLDPNGVQEWVLEGELEATRLTSLAVDSSGVVHAYYSTGTSDTLARYDSNGTLLSARALDQELEGAASLVITSEDELYFGDDRGSDGYFLVHLCPDP